jgi:ABC-type nitrate/sulfonate/bicarbonate transport system substrate-binding protein
LCTGAKRRRACAERDLEPRQRRALLTQANIIKETGMLQPLGAKPMTRRDILELVGTSAFAGAAGLTMAQPASAQAPEMKRVVLGQAKAAGQSAQFPLAIANGLFAEQGLDVSMTFFNSAAEMNEALASGSMHITATGDVPAIGLMAHKGPAKCLAPLSDFSYDQGMVVRRGITEPKQLEGAKLALTKGTTATMLIERFIQKHGLDEKKIGLIHMSAPEQIPAFITGDIDGLISWEPWLWIATQKSPGAQVMQRAPGLFKTYNLLLASDQYISKYPNTLKAVFRGLLKANDQMQTAQGQDRAAQLVHQNEMPNIPEPVLLDMIKTRTFSMTIDPPLLDDLQRMTDFLLKAGRINRRVDVREWLRPALLREIRPDLVKVSV